MRWVIVCTVSAIIAAGNSAAAASRCDRLFELFGRHIMDATCVESTDLTTKNPATTPANNLLPGLPPFAFTPQTDRAVISPAVPTPVTKAVPGVQLNGRIVDDPAGQARILFRLPNQWNGKLVVAGSSETRSEL